MGPQEAHDYPSLEELRPLLIPTRKEDRWDHGELPHAILNLEDQTALSRCEALLRLAAVVTRAFDGTYASRAVALRDVLLELLPKELDHPYCSVLRVLAGLRPGTAGRRREQRQQVAGMALGTDRHPATTRTVRRRVKEHCWPWLFDRLVEREVKERNAAEVDGVGSLWPSRDSKEDRAKRGEAERAQPSMPRDGAFASSRTLELASSTELYSAPDVEGSGPTFGWPHPREEEDDTDRRRFLQGLGRLTGALLAATRSESVELDRQLEASDLGPATLEQLDRTIERFGREYLHRPLSEVLTEVRAWRQYVAQLLRGRHTLVQKQHLYGITGWLSCLLGSLAFDLDHESAAETHYGTALHLAREAGHNQLAAWVYGSRALMTIYTGQPQLGVAFAQAGQKLAPPGSVSTVRLLSLEARAHARVGDRPSFERAMGLATEAFDHLPEQSTGSIFSFSAPYFPYYGGSCYVWLHEPRRAVEQAERAIELCDAAAADWPVARVVARIDLATALVQLEQLEDACTVGTEALGIYASGRPIGPVVRRAAELRSALQRNQDLPAVRNFSERFHAVCSEQAAPLA